MIRKEGSVKLFSKRYNPIFWVVGLTLLIVGLLSGSAVLGSRLAERQVPQVAASHKINVEVALGHLWLEEAIAGDSEVDIVSVWAHFDEALWYATAMLEGGQNDEWSIIPLREAKLIHALENIREQLVAFRMLAEERWDAIDQSRIGSDRDQYLDAQFEEVIEGVYRVESMLQAVSIRELGEIKGAQAILIALCLGLGGLTGAFLYSYEKKRRSDFETLHESEENLSITLKSIGDAVITTDADGCITGLNPVAEALTGWLEVDAVTRPLDEVFRIIHAQTREKVEAPVKKVLREGVVIGLANHTVLIARDGAEHQIADSAAPIRDTQGTIFGVVLVFRDVTEEYDKDRQILDRMRELRCMYAVAESVRTRGTIGEVFQDVAGLIPPRQLLTDKTHGRVVFDGKAYLSEGFEETPWKQSAEIRAGDKACGSVDIFYSEGIPNWDHGSFKLEEQNLIDGVARVLGETVAHRRAEAVAHEAERQSSTLMANLPGMAYQCGTDADWTMKFVSCGCKPLTGYEPEDLIGNKVISYGDIIHPDDRQRIWDEVEAARNHKKPFQFTYRIITAEGHVKWAWEQVKEYFSLEENCNILEGFITDITELKEAQAERVGLMAAIEQSVEMVVITDIEGVIEYVNPAFEKITGYSSEEALGQNPRFLQSGAHDAAFYKAMWDTLQSNNVWSGKFINKKKDGSFYTETTTISPVHDASGQRVNYVAVKHDVTDELKKEEQFRQAQKMDSIGQLVGGVAHDFNNLLQIINGYADIARAQLTPTHIAGGSIDEIIKAGEHAKGLVQQLLAFSRRQVMDPVDLDLNEEIQHVQKMLGRLIGEHIEVKVIAGKELEMVFADKNQIQQVLINLCVNARDAMPEGGVLTLKTEGVLIGEEDLNVHTWAQPGRYICLHINDTGCGMDPEVCSRIFEPFFTTKEVGKGTGLGLSTVYGILKQNEGHIDVTSKPGKGTEFHVYLPVTQSLSTGPEDSTDEYLPPVLGGAETILVVEDDPMILELSTHILSHAGYRVLSASDGEDAVRVFGEHADEIDCVMMDVVMPRMGGKEAMKIIRSKRASVRYLFVSGYSPDAGHTDFIKEKNLHLLGKPYESGALLRKIRDVLDDD